jgi:SAM-dependent methyltransferase
VTELAPPSPFFVQQSARLRTAARRGPVLDLACGRGRHCIAAAALGAYAVGVDRNRGFLADLRAAAHARRLRVDAIRADLEKPREFPFAPGCCGAILVFRFLFRPIAPRIEEALRPGGLLLYETFTVHQHELPGGPRNPAFLLAEGELPELFPSLEILESWEGISEGNAPTAVARLAARKPSPL